MNAPAILTLDLDQTRRFLGLIAPDTDQHIFCAFFDDKSNAKGKPPRTFHGTFEQHAAELERLNGEGYGIFFAVHEFRNDSRKKENLVSCRAVFREADQPDVPPLPIEPHVTIETSPNKKHEYIIIPPTSAFEFWDDTMDPMVGKYGSDPNARDRSRVLRLPGFYHQKNPNRPHLVRIISESGAPPIPIATVARKLGSVEKRTEAHPENCTQVEQKVATVSTPYALAALKSICAELRQATQPGRNDATNKAAFAAGQLLAAGELVEDEVGPAVIAAAQDTGLPDWRIIPTLRSGLEAGKQHPRPPRPTPAAGDFNTFRDADPRPQPEPPNKDQEQPASWFRTAYDHGSVSRFIDSLPPPLDWVFDTTLLARTVGMMVGPGAVGKSLLALLLLISIATGRTILPFFRPTKPGKALGIFAEDGEDVLHHRIHALLNNLFDFDPEAMDLVRQNLKIIAATGIDVRMLDTSGHTLESSLFFKEAFEVLKDQTDLRLLVLDPFSRVHGGEENDNAAGTYFITLLERIAKTTGCAVLGLHHVSKRAGITTAGFDIEAAMSQDAARGASGLTNACRWQCNLFGLPEKVAKKELGVNRARPGEYLAIRVCKKNYGAPEDTYFLQRGHGGLLSAVQATTQENPPDLNEVLRGLLLKVVSESEADGRFLTRRQIVDGYTNEWRVERQDITRPSVDRAIASCLVHGQLFERCTTNRQRRKTTYLSTVKEV